MAPSPQQPGPILSEAISLRAQAFRRWRQAAEVEATERKRRIYEALAAFECDRYDRLVQRYLPHRGPQPEGLITGVRPEARPDLALPRGARGAPALRTAKVAAEAERRTWAAVLRKTPRTDPQHLLLSDLVEEARRARDLVGHV